MARQGNKYEQTVAFILVLYRDGQKEEQIYLQDEMTLPISKKVYKTTYKNVDVYIKELLQSDLTIKTIRLDRISHIKIYER